GVDVASPAGSGAWGRCRLGRGRDEWSSVGTREDWAMPGLVPPDPRLRRSFAAALAEFAAEGRGSVDDRTVIGSYLRDHADVAANEEDFEQFCEAVRAQALESTPRPRWVGARDRAVVGRW